MKLKAYAKLNLYLDVINKLENGYHSLDSEVVFLNLADDVYVENADELIVEGSIFPDEIMLKAANLMQLEFGISEGAKIKIMKNIPSGAGLGGGSADAAAVMIGLKELWGIDCGDDELYELGLKLGADVPACLYNQITGRNSVHFSGVGEVLTEVGEKQDMFFMLVNPNKSLSTKEVFESFELEKNSPAKTNHLEKTAIKLMPEIEEMLQAIEQEKAVVTRMTGSGATCFGVFDEKALADSAAENIAEKKPDWWVKVCGLAGG